MTPDDDTQRRAPLGTRGEATGAEAHARGNRRRPNEITVGDEVPLLEELKNAASTSRDTVFMYMSPTCPFSNSQVTPWLQLVNDLGAGYDVQFLARETDTGIEEYLAENGFKSVPWHALGFDAMRTLKLYRTPTTVVVNASGEVSASWIGLWGDSTRSDVYEHLGLQLN